MNSNPFTETALEQLESRIQPLVQCISRHPVFDSIRTIKDLQQFSQIHVFAVYDFQCLLKALQKKVSCFDLFWQPPVDPLSCHLVNAMVTEEESDQLPDGSYLSHFELYLRAMQQCCANTQPIQVFLTILETIQPNFSLNLIWDLNCIPSTARAFMRDTFEIIQSDSVIKIAASFAFARENITSPMFSQILKTLGEQTPESVSLFTHYFNRHIELDGGQHGTQAKQMVMNLCGEDPQKWAEATEAAIFSLNSRISLLDGIHSAIRNPEKMQAVAAGVPS